MIDWQQVADWSLVAFYGALAVGAGLLTLAAAAEERRAARNHAVRTGRAR